MNTKKTINELWQQMRDAIDATRQGADYPSPEADLNGYCQNLGFWDKLQILLDAEASNERQHRRNRSFRGFSVESAAKLILMRNVASGAGENKIIPASHILVIRKTAFEALVIGFLIARKLPAGWVESVTELEYEQLMAKASR